MSSTQDTFGSRERYWSAEHLTLDDPDDTPSTLTVDVDRRECWCDECHCRVTVGPNGREYGHHPDDCRHHCWDGEPEADRWDGVEV